MKPVQLTLSALGPYADETRISFEDVDQGLFLITGETGSGKTMIFDAIMFALYDDSSGTSRGSGSLRSDFASPDTETFVELDFLLRSQLYRVRRSPRYERPKLRGQGVTEQVATVELTLPDGKIMTSKKEVDASLVELIGLDKDQFRQVAMIAQGAFFDLIEASSLERARIYRKLFNTSLYEAMQNRLLARYAEARSTLQSLSGQLFMDLQRFPFPEWAQDLAEERDRLLTDRDLWAVERFLEALEAVQGRLKEERAAAQHKREAEGRLLTERQARLERIRQGNQHLDLLEKARQELAALEASRQAHEAEVRKLEAADRAARQVTAPYREWQQAKRRLEALTQSLDQAKTQLDQADVAYQQALNQVQALSAKRVYLEALPGEIAGLEKAISDLDKAKDLTLALARMDRARKDKVKELEAKEAEQRALERALLEDRASLEALAQVDKLVLESETEGARIQARLEDLARIRAGLGQLESQGEALDGDRIRLEALMTQWKQADLEARKAEEALFLERAGLLARDLEEGQPCPVCGSLDHPQRASLSPKAPTREEVDRLQEAREACRAQVDALSRSAEVQEARMEASFRGLLREAGPLVPAALPAKAPLSQGLEPLGQALGQAVAGQKEALDKALKALAAAREQKEARDKLLDKTKAQADLLQKLAPQKGQVEEALVTMREEAARMRGELDSLERGLPGKSEEGLKQALGEKREALRSLRAASEEARDRESQGARTLAQVKATLVELDKQRQSLARETADLEKAFQTSVREAGFESEADYQAALLPEADRMNLEKRVGEARSLREHKYLDVQRLAREAQGLVRQDEKREGEALEGLEAAVRQGEARVSQLMTQEAMSQASLESIGQSYRMAAEAKDQESMLKDLADLASGKHAEADQVSFETYVQTWYFAQVIRQANQRLRQMTGGRYSLRRTQEAENRRARTGLDLSVDDHWNAKTRSVSSLSGGEKFQTVLSLALGLSDVVMAHAGGVEINSLFIDEGFGSLDDHSLQEAMGVLQGLAEDNRMIGLISHLGLLTQAIDKKLVTQKGDSGSRVSWA